MIFHICVPDKFTMPFIAFTSQHFDIQSHKFFIQPTDTGMCGVDPDSFAILKAGKSPFQLFCFDAKEFGILSTIKLMFELYRCEKIIIHGLFLFKRTAQLLVYCPRLLKKSFWVMWGGDFYFVDEADHLKREIIQKIGHLLTYIPGDIRYVKDHYGATGTPLDCLMYVSNVFESVRVPARRKSTIRLQVGNSASSTNQHQEVFAALEKYKDCDIQIICPLSYGERKYRDHVISLGKQLFGDKFLPYDEFLPYGDYQDLLASIDIAVFNHNRQQGMGNIITHLGLGHKVYLRSDQSPWELLTGIGLELNDIFEGIDLEYNRSIKNQRLIASYFTLDRLVAQWRKIYESGS